MKEIFITKDSTSQQLRSINNLVTNRFNSIKFGKNSLGILGPNIWNHLPNKYKTINDLHTFKRLMKQWNGPLCACSFCKFINNKI